ncbi:MAG: hypothetical protein PHO91_01550 [Patescibacteria group bacterium]|nr:hypothetical protein [Patescibacteria group bacterium]
MKRMTYVLSIVILLISSMAFAASHPIVNKDDTAKVPSWDWVDVLNQEVVYSGNNEFTYGETCGIECGGTVTVIGEVDEGNVLVRYTSPHGQTYGTPCPSGIIFQLSKERFTLMTAEYLANMKAEQEHRQKIANIIKEAEG